MATQQPLVGFEKRLRSSKTRSWLKGYLGKISSSWIEYDDLYQEASVAIWQTWNKFVDKFGYEPPDTYLIRAAEWRVLQVLRGQPLEGQPRVKGSFMVRPKSQVQVNPEIITKIADRPEPAVVLAEIRGDIHEAVSALPMQVRDKVLRRFWLDELVSFSGHWWHGPSGAKEFLQHRLAHLRTYS